MSGTLDEKQKVRILSDNGNIHTYDTYIQQLNAKEEDVANE